MFLVIVCVWEKHSIVETVLANELVAVVSRVQALVPPKIRRVKGLMLVKSVEVQSPSKVRSMPTERRPVQFPHQSPSSKYTTRGVTRTNGRIVTSASDSALREVWKGVTYSIFKETPKGRNIDASTRFNTLRRSDTDSLRDSQTFSHPGFYIGSYALPTIETY
ncbi:hypothetical protein TNCV_3587261 [Trichonephila clavipes]|nr:hypothetical protein TNCV_3587261 [Trichonephila clavipes]